MANDLIPEKRTFNEMNIEIAEKEGDSDESDEETRDKFYVSIWQYNESRQKKFKRSHFWKTDKEPIKVYD